MGNAMKKAFEEIPENTKPKEKKKWVDRTIYNPVLSPKQAQYIKQRLGSK